MCWQFAPVSERLPGLTRPGLNPVFVAAVGLMCGLALRAVMRSALCTSMIRRLAVPQQQSFKGDSTP